MSRRLPVIGSRPRASSLRPWSKTALPRVEPRDIPLAGVTSHCLLRLLLPIDSILNLGSNGSLSFSANFNSKLGSLVFFAVSASTPKGTWSFNSRVLDPKTGEVYSEDLNAFVVE